ncbi:MAG: hypothetical protein QOI06_2700 [Nocardioidaceae bacterium]|nr:hypothetical protein [Nocardioidaceae bacterium]
MTRAPTAGLPIRVQRGAQDGSALVELVWLSLILLIPLVYILITLVTVQRSAYGVTEAARAAGRAYVLSPNPATGRQRAYAAARLAMRDQGITLPASDLTIVCHPNQAACLQPGSTVEVRISYQAPLPAVPELLGHNPATIAVSAHHVEPFGTYREGSR